MAHNKQPSLLPPVRSHGGSAFPPSLPPFVVGCWFLILPLYIVMPPTDGASLIISVRQSHQQGSVSALIRYPCNLCLKDRVCFISLD